MNSGSCVTDYIVLGTGSKRRKTERRLRLFANYKWAKFQRATKLCSHNGHHVLEWDRSLSHGRRNRTTQIHIYAVFKLSEGGKLIFFLNSGSVF
uniref:Uncharacterized protein n=1 Tax=Anguilla anguilla TaxID=7936 RepID=A0A0E9RE42_ANGAN